jgi:hypothetical protein
MSIGGVRIPEGSQALAGIHATSDGPTVLPSWFVSHCAAPAQPRTLSSALSSAVLLADVRMPTEGIGPY